MPFADDRNLIDAFPAAPDRAGMALEPAAVGIQKPAADRDIPFRLQGEGIAPRRPDREASGVQRHIVTAAGEIISQFQPLGRIGKRHFRPLEFSAVAAAPCGSVAARIKPQRHFRRRRQSQKTGRQGEPPE